MQKRPLTWVLLSILSIGILFVPIQAFAADSPPDSPELILLNWAEYLDPELLKEFEQRHGVRVREIYFESDDLRDDMMLDTNAEGFDIVLVNGVAMDVYQQQGWLTLVDAEKMPNLQWVDSRWRKAFSSAENMGIPYAWGTLGIAYRKDLLGREINSWMDLFRPEKDLQNKIGLMRSSRDLMGMALKALGYSANSSNSQEILEAEQLLLELKPYVHNFTYVSVDEDSSLIKGDIVASMMYSGDALAVKDNFDQVEYVVPKEGGNIWVDYWVVLKSSRNKEWAWKFLDFLNEPKIAARASEYIFYASPNTAAEQYLPVEFLKNPLIYPDEQSLKNSEFYQELPPRIEKKINQIYTNVVD